MEKICYNRTLPLKFHILIVSKGRKSLNRTIESIKRELKKEDEVTIVFDGEVEGEFDLEGMTVIYEEFKGNNGHPHRTKYQKLLTGDYILHFDDDDYYTLGWRNTVEAIIRRENYPDIITFLSYSLHDKVNQFIRKEGPVLLTGNTITKNIAKFNDIPWECSAIGDLKRYKEIQNISDNIKYSDFVIMHKG